jgi:hypothetical protein
MKKALSDMVTLRKNFFFKLKKTILKLFMKKNRPDTWPSKLFMSIMILIVLMVVPTQVKIKTII